MRWCMQPLQKNLLGDTGSSEAPTQVCGPMINRRVDEIDSHGRRRFSKMLQI